MTPDKPLKSSTTQVKATQFRPHGRVDIWMDGQLQHYEATGPFNKELVDCLAIAQLNSLQTLQPTGPWVSICTIVESALATPDGLARYAELMRTPKPAELTPVATAFVIGPEVEGGTIMAPLFAKIYADIGRPFKTFETLAEAQRWARTLTQVASAP